MGLSTIPVTITMGIVSKRVNDRALTLFSTMVILAGCCIQLVHGGYPRLSQIEPNRNNAIILIYLVNSYNRNLLGSDGMVAAAFILVEF